MRAPLLLGVLALVAGGAAAQSTHVERDGWTQFLPDWQEGPGVVSYQNRSADVPSGVRFATDGHGWLYATTEAREALDEPPAGCEPGAEGTFVLLSARCGLALHPGISCSGTDVCERAMGVIAPGGTPPATRPTEGGLVTSAPPTPPGDHVPDCKTMRFAKCTPDAGPAGAVIVLLVAAMLARHKRM